MENNSKKVKIKIMKERAEHLDWCKKRALEYVELNDVPNALASFISDLGKHEETVDHPAIMLATGLSMGGHLSTPRQMKEFIEGTN